MPANTVLPWILWLPPNDLIAPAVTKRGHTAFEVRQVQVVSTAVHVATCIPAMDMWRLRNERTLVLNAWLARLCSAHSAFQVFVAKRGESKFRDCNTIKRLDTNGVVLCRYMRSLSVETEQCVLHMYAYLTKTAIRQHSQSISRQCYSMQTAFSHCWRSNVGRRVRGARMSVCIFSRPAWSHSARRKRE